MTTETPLPPGIDPTQVNALATLLRYATDGAFVAALYNTAAVRDAVMDALEASVAPLPVYHFTFTEENANPLAYRDKLPADALEKPAAIFLYDFYRAGERMYSYLELQREALARYPHSLVFWLTPGERGKMVRQAPNFWSQRSGVFDFTVHDPATLMQLREEMAGGSRHYENLDEWERKLRLYQGLIDEYEAQEAPQADTLLDLYNKVGQLYNDIGDRAHALTYYQKALALARTEEDRYWEGVALNNISQIYDARGDYDTALHYLQQALAIRQEIGDKAGEGTTLNNISQIYDARGDYDTALHYLQQALAISQEIGNRAGESVTLYNIAMIYREWKDYQKAIELLEQVVALDEALGHPDLESDRAMLEKVRAAWRGGSS